MWRSPALDEAAVFARPEWTARALVHAGWVGRYDHAANRRLAMDLRARARRALRDGVMADWGARWAERGDAPTRNIQPATLAWNDASGRLHRIGAPALIEPGLKLVFYRHGLLHRDDGPALIHASGRREWYHDGVRHRIGGPARIDSSGDQEFYVLGERHRVDGPAVIGADGRREWWMDGMRHRADGPAVTYRAGHGHDQWWVAGRRTSPLDEYFLVLPAAALPLAETLFPGVS